MLVHLRVSPQLAVGKKIYVNPSDFGLSMASRLGGYLVLKLDSQHVIFNMCNSEHLGKAREKKKHVLHT